MCEPPPVHVLILPSLYIELERLSTPMRLDSYHQLSAHCTIPFYAPLKVTHDILRLRRCNGRRLPQADAGAT